MSPFPGHRESSTQESLPAAGALFAALIGGIDLAVALLDLEGRVQLWNPAAERMTGWSAREVIGNPVPWTPDRRRAETTRLIDRVRHGESIRGETLDRVRKDGRPLPIRLWAVPVRGPDGEIGNVLVIAEDVTASRRINETELSSMLHELKTGNEERRRLLGRLIHVQEEARRRIANDVHDDAIQKIVAAGMRLEMLKRQRPELADDEQVAALQDAISAAALRLRNMVFELRPAILDTSGLVAAIRWYVDELEGAGPDTEHRIESRLSQEPPEELRIVLFRVAQEAITNARKHASAETVTVWLNEEGEGIALRVEDDGIGFDDAALRAPAPGHLGLVEARERVELADGRFRVTSAPGIGTTVEAWLPLR